MLNRGNVTAVNVLIVEDEFLVALQLEDILTHAGHRVIGIVPDQASVHALPEPPDVALVDLNLRDGPSGPTIAQQLAERYGTVIVYVTANPSQIEQPVSTALGVVQKPFSQHSILAAVALASYAKALSPPIEVELYSRPA